MLITKNSLPDSVRLVAQFVAMGLMFQELGILHLDMWCVVLISLVMVYLVPQTVLAHWIYLVAVLVVLALAYVLFMKKYYHLHEEWLKGLNR